MWTSRTGTPAMTGDRGSIVIGWLTRIAVVSAVVGVLGYDVVSIGQGRFSVADEADQVAQDAHSTWSDTHSVDQARKMASSEAATHGDTIAEPVAQNFTVDAKTGLVTVTLQHSVETLLAKRFGFSRSWTTMRATGQAQDQS
jgi:hypothetical protein